MSDIQHISEVLQQRFGFTEFRPGQVEVITHLLAGNSAAAVFPTGAGKSLCYQLPSLMLKGLTLVVSPLIALMKDQIDALQLKGINARRIDSTLTGDEYRDVMDQLRSGQIKMLFVAPERFNNERFREAILPIHISLFAVDEAHCISEWGHNFRPDYLKLAEFVRVCAAERVLALTATATQQVLDDICAAFDIAPQCATNTGFYRPNLTLISTPVEANRRDEFLLNQLQQQIAGPTIVYVTLQRTADDVAERLASAGLPAKSYHAGMNDELRVAVQEWFIESDHGIIVATIAFGMGVDKSNIRYVYHYNLPKSLENYAQEIGRSGRDGAPSICHMYLCMDDINVLENFVYGDTPTEGAIRGVLDSVFSADESFDISFYDLSAEHDIRILVVRTLMTYLELDGYLSGGTPFYSKYQFQYRLPREEILSRFSGERRVFLNALFNMARQSRVWATIDLDLAAADTGSTRDRIVRALDYLGEQGMLEIKVTGLRHRYRRLKSPADLDAFAELLHSQALDREAREIGRLNQVLDLAGLDGCQTSALCAYFDHPLAEPCGHCSWCLNGKTPTILPERIHGEIDRQLPEELSALRQAHPQLFAEATILARFLCGISSPKINRARLRSHKLFGSLSDVPFMQVLSEVQRN